VKDVMQIAIGYFQGEEVDESVFDFFGFKQTDIELDALHVVFNYLSRAGLTWTYDCLQNESHVQPSRPISHLLFLLYPELDILPESASSRLRLSESTDLMLDSL
jgi:hypothetical protein